MLLKVDPLESFGGEFRVPSSKPETQRAILTGTLADGVSHVFNDLRCDETETMKRACRELGAEITDQDGCLEIRGCGRPFRHDGQLIHAEGSGLVFRTMTALSSVHGSPVVVTGNEVLCQRVMAPLLDALRDLGADVESICHQGRAPVVNWGRGLHGGRCLLPGDVSSQFVTAILFAAPFAESAVEIEVMGDVYSQSYIKQTLSYLVQAGVRASVSDDYRYYRVEPSAYGKRDVAIPGDFTSASYLLAAAALYPGRSVLANISSESAQGEYSIVPILERLGLRIAFDRGSSSLIVDNHSGSLHGDFEVDARNCPNIVPTLAAIGAYVKGSLRVVGGRITRFHKAPRIEAMVTELSQAGVDIRSVYDGDACDGFEVRGAPTYSGGRMFSSWGDHRIFMSLFVASLRMRSANLFSGFNDVRLSFPEFFSEFAKAGVRTLLVDEENNCTPQLNSDLHAGISPVRVV